MKKLKNMNLEDLCDLKREVQSLIDDKEPSFEELLTMGVLLEYTMGNTPKSLKNKYNKKLEALQTIYKH